jgi:hypothetical protein
MTRFLKTNLDPDGKFLRIDAGFRGGSGAYFLQLHRLPPEYAKPPGFLIELTAERLEVRGAEVSSYLKAYAIQDFSPKELQYLKTAKEGATHAPFFNFSYPTVMKRLGKTFYKLTDAEVAPLVDARFWKLVGGER